MIARLPGRAAVLQQFLALEWALRGKKQSNGCPPTLVRVTKLLVASGTGTSP